MKKPSTTVGNELQAVAALMVGASVLMTLIAGSLIHWPVMLLSSIVLLWTVQALTRKR